MKKAIYLALKAEGMTSPNPLVGAVFVKKNKIIAEGYHHGAGEAHAEVEALKQLSPQQVRSGTLYVTLEPCAHFGRTPPCTNLLIKKGVKHVVIAMEDPNPKVAGKGIKQLEEAGIKVEVGILEEQAKTINEAYIYAIQHNLPFVTLKMALTLDGKIATKNGDSKWISNEKSRTEVHRLRRQVDAILTSAKTVSIDNPHLGVRMVKGRDPLRIILDPALETSLTAQVYRDGNVLVAANRSASSIRKKIFEKAGIKIHWYGGKKIPLKNLLKDLFKQGLNSIMIEAGSGLATAFLKDHLIQKVYFFIAPKIIGEGKNVLGDLNITKMGKAYQIKDRRLKKFGDDIAIIGYFQNIVK